MSETDVLISLTHSIDESWLTVPATVLGDVPAGEPTPDLYVLIGNEAYADAQDPIAGARPLTSWILDQRAMTCC